MTNQISNKISNKITSEMSVVTSLLLAEVNKGSKSKIELRTVNEKSDSNAFTNGRNLIQIPLNFQNLGGSDGKRWRSIGYGYLSHETSHCRNTDFSCMREISSYGQEGKTLLNVIEDPRIERLTVAQYPGQWEHINNMNAHIIEQGWWSGPQGDSVTVYGTLNSYCLYYGETVSGFELTRPLMEEWEPIFNDLFSQKFGDDVPDKIRSFVKEAVLSDDKKAAVEAVKNILELLQNQKGKSDETSKDEKSEEAKDNKSEASKDGKSEGAKDNKSNDSKDGKSEEAKDNKSNASKDGKSEEAKDEKSNASKGETSEGAKDEKSNTSKDETSEGANDQKSNASKGEASEEAKGQKSETSKDEKSEGSSQRFGGKLLTSEDENKDHPETASQKLFQGMKQNCKENAGACTSLPMMSNVGGRLTNSPYNIIGNESTYKPIGLRLKREFQRKLQSRVLGNKGCSQSGHKILRNKLSGIATGNYQIFSNRDMVKLPNVAIEVLVDTSGSMTEIMRPALNAAGAILVGLENLKGIETEMSLFPGYFYDGHYNLYDGYTIAKGFNEPLKPQRVSAICGGGTDCNYGVMGATLNLKTRKKKDKICIVITDGDINSNTKDVIDYGISQGIKYYCIGLDLLNTEDVSNFFEHFVNIDNINELQQVLIKLVREVIEI